MNEATDVEPAIFLNTPPRRRVTLAGRLCDPTPADAILDRLVNNAYKVELKQNSRRKCQPEPTT